MLKHLQFVKQVVLDRWGGSLNDLNNTSYAELMGVLGAKKTDGENRPGGVQSAYDFFSKPHAF